MAKPFERVRKWLVRIALILGIIWGLSWVITWSLPYILNLDEIKAEIEKELKTETTLIVDLGDIYIRPSLFQGLKVGTHNTVIDYADKTPLLTTQKFQIRIPYWTLITRQKFQLRHIFLTNTRILSTRKRIREFSQTLSKKQNKQEPVPEGSFMRETQPRKPEDDFILMENMDIHLSDALWREGEATLIIPRYNIAHLFSNDNVEAGGNLIIKDPLLSKGTVRLDMNEAIDPVVVHSGNLNAKTLKSLKLKMSISPYEQSLLGAVKSTLSKLQPQKTSVQQAEISYLAKKNNGEIRIKSTNLDTALLQNTLDFLASFTGEQTLVLAPPYRLAGFIKADTKLVADLDKLEKRKLYLKKSNGYLDLTELVLLNNDNPILKSIDGNVLFKKTTLHLDNIVAALNTSPIMFDGDIQPNSEQVKVNVTGNNVSVGEVKDVIVHLARAFRVDVPDIDRYEVLGQSNVKLLVYGTYNKLNIGGTIVYTGGSLYDRVTGLRLTNIYSDINLDETTNRLNINKLSGNLGESGFSASGYLGLNNTPNNLSLQTDHINLSTLAQQLKGSSIVPESLSKQLEQLKGIITADLKIRGTTNKPVITGIIDGSDIVASLPDMQSPFIINRLQAKLTESGIDLAPTQIGWGPLNLNAEGNLSTKGDANFKIASAPIPTSSLRDNHSFYESLLKQPLPEIWNTAGSSQFLATVKGSQINASLMFNEVGVSWKDGDFPVHNMNGQLDITGALNNSQINQLAVASNSLRLLYGNSQIRPVVNFQQGTGNRMDIQTTGVLSPLVVNHLLTPRLATHAPYKEIPFTLSLLGKAPSLLTTKTPFYTRQQLAGSFNMDLSGILSDDTWMKADLFVQDDSFKLQQGRVHLSEHSDIWAEGTADNIFSPAAMGYNFHILTGPTLELNEWGDHFDHFFNNSSGYIAADLEIKGNETAAQNVDGWVEISEVKVPKLKVANITGSADFKGDVVNYDFRTINLPGVQISATATSDNALQYPVPLEDVNIRGTSFSIPGFQYFTREVLQDTLQKEVFSKFVRPWQEGDPVVPITFNDADLALNEVIYQNIILENLKSDMSVYTNGMFELKNSSVEAAGGLAQGYIAMSPIDNSFTTVELRTQHVKANALTRALLGVSNQIFGDVNSNIRFTTQGHDETELLDNANGLVRVKVTDGRLPSIAKIETLLTAANVLRGGVLGLNLNNLFRTMSPFNTNYFAEMTGDMFIANKTLHTDNLLSNGENLDLLIEGQLGMETGKADMLITGKMSQDVAGKLGTIGSLSIGKIFKYIPVLGFLPGSESRGLIYQIPGLGYTPGLGGQARKYNQFQVVLEGPVEDPASVKSFRWLKSTDY